MKNFTSPLNNIRIASPCSANWDEMYGDDRKRFCGECKLNVYNLSGMSRPEAENLLANSEGRLCVRFYRRNDGTILTQDCPVGWQKIKRRVSGVAAAIFSMIVGIFGGIFAFNKLNDSGPNVMGKMEVVKPVNQEPSNVNVRVEPDTHHQEMGNFVTAGTPVNLEDVRKELKKNRK